MGLVSMGDELFTHPSLTVVLADLVGADEQRGADDYWGCCPFHQERTPSFHINGGAWHCFGACRAGGGALDLVMRVKRYEKAQAVQWLAQRLGVPLARSVDLPPPVAPPPDRRAQTVALAQRWVNLAGQPQRQRERDIIGGTIRDLLRPQWTSRQWERFVEDFGEVDAVGLATAQFRYRTERQNSLTAGATMVPDDVAQAMAVAQAFFVGRPEWRPLAAARGVSPETAERFGMGYAPADDTLLEALLRRGVSWRAIRDADLMPSDAMGGDIRPRYRHRLMLPLHDGVGSLVAFAGRVVGGDHMQRPKYLNSHSSPWYPRKQMFYGLHLAEADILRTQSVVLVEGYFDVIQLHQAGQTNVVGICGANLTDEQAGRLRAWDVDVTLCLDTDEAGSDGVVRSVAHLLAVGVWPRVVRLEGVKDPDEWVRQGHAQPLTELAPVRLLDWIPRERWAQVIPTITDPFVAHTLQHHFGFADRKSLGGLRLVEKA